MALQKPDQPSRKCVECLGVEQEIHDDQKWDKDQQQIDGIADDFAGYRHWGQMRAILLMQQELDRRPNKELAPDLSSVEG
jgi:hypothetical protein